MGTHSFDTWQLVDEMDRYMHEVVYSPDYPYGDIREECINRHELCAFWATIGECETNAGYMTVSCAPACRSCEKLSFQYRCPLQDAETLAAQNAWKPGDLNAMFERIVSTGEYKSTVLAQPNGTTRIGHDSEDHAGTWIVMLDDFLSAEECERLIEWGARRGYEISREVGDQLFDGTYDAIQIQGRTSTNAWCVDNCYDDPMVQQVMRRIEQLTGLPEENAEFLQLLRYDVSQFYHAHHDYKDYHRDRAYGSRILTFFMYLNDVPAGGETRFPKYGVVVPPKQGRALLFPNVYNNAPETKDPTTEHESLPVQEGLKYGANTWLHQRNFKTPFVNNCV
jgi:prolyl 4-hydroxylase